MSLAAPPARPTDDAERWPHPCFDAELATAPTRTLSIDAITDLLHVTHAPEQIAVYRRAMERGDRFPPIAVVRLAGRYFVANGHKRLSAYRARRVDDIVVEVWPLHRWVRDQWEQLAHKSRQQWRLLWHSPFDAQARRQARRLFWDTLGHWQRIARSLRRSRPD